MGRYATIPCEFQENGQLACSGVLAQAISKTIGSERFEEWVITLTYYETISVMMAMIGIMQEEITLNYQEIRERETGYRKLSILMLWHRDATDQQTLTFC